jgi:hypothetical protein
MDRRLLFPPIAAIACVHPASAQMSDAEKALRARAEQFYQLEVDGQFRKAEAFVAEDTKDLYYRNSKPEISKFHIDKVAIDPDGKHAVVTVNISTTMRNPAFGAMNFSSPVPMTWKLDNGQWCWYQVQDGYIDTPFGKWHVSDANSNGKPPALPGLNSAVDPTKISSLVTIDRTSVELNADGTASAITITNHMSGTIDVKLASAALPGLSVSIDKEKLSPGETGTVSFKATAGAKPSGKITIAAGPIQWFVIDVNTK